MSLIFQSVNPANLVCKTVKLTSKSTRSRAAYLIMTQLAAMLTTPAVKPCGKARRRKKVCNSRYISQTCGKCLLRMKQVSTVWKAQKCSLTVWAPSINTQAIWNLKKSFILVCSL